MQTAVVIPNWNGRDEIGDCLTSLQSQTLHPHVIVVDNGSVDDSVNYIRETFPDVELIELPKNTGFAGGVNTGIKRAMALGVQYVALLNNDAVAERDWLKNLVGALEENEKTGIVTSKIISTDKTHLDSTGDYLTSWGLPYPRGRSESDLNKYDAQTEIFAASGGASLYRAKMLKEVGLFDEDFFAYYEDVDISFRAQLAGWKVQFIPEAIVYHKISATSSKIKGFTTFQTLKNLPWLTWKNIPTKYLWRVLPRFYIAYAFFLARALSRGDIVPALKGLSVSLLLLPKKLTERRRIQTTKAVSDEYIWSMLVHDLPPNAHALRKLRSKWWRLIRKT